MRTEIAWWDLDQSSATIDSLREHLRDATVEQWTAVHGLRLKFWIADQGRNRWGAVMLWETDRPDVLPPNRAAELIGYPPTHRSDFDVEAMVEGMYTVADLHGLGPVFTSRPGDGTSRPGDGSCRPGAAGPLAAAPDQSSRSTPADQKPSDRSSP